MLKRRSKGRIHAIFLLLKLGGFIWGITQLVFVNVVLTSHCDEAELELFRNVSIKTDQLVLCKKRSKVSYYMRIMLRYELTLLHRCKSLT